MNWDNALKLIHKLREEPVEPPGTATRAKAGRAAGPRSLRAASLCIASGKGGTGKSVVTASLARLFGGRGRTLIVDADMGVGNAHILQDVAPEQSFVGVVQGRCSVEQAIVGCLPGVDLISAGSGVSRMAALSPYELHLIAQGLEALDGRYDYQIVDSAAGISEQTLTFASACDVVLLVTTPDPTAMTDAYAFIKVLLQRRAEARCLLLVNRALDEQQGAEVAERIRHVCFKFLAHEPRWLGAVPEDRAVLDSVAARQPVVTHQPGSPAALALHALSVPLLEELDLVAHAGLGASLLRGVGFVAHRA